MIRYLTPGEVLELYERIMEQSGGLRGVRSLEALESALVQPGIAFGGEELHPSVAAKAAALGFTIVMSHPFLDGNKRIGTGDASTCSRRDEA